jgi:hypothetical protein
MVKRIYPITIGRVLQALENKIKKYLEYNFDDLILLFEDYGGKVKIRGKAVIFQFGNIENRSTAYPRKVLFSTLIDGLQSKIFKLWDKAKENGRECTDDDQSDETIEALLQLLEDSISEYENSK